MITLDLEHVRGVVIGLTRNGREECSNQLLAEALGLETEPEKARMRSRLAELVRRNELVRVGRGHYRYNPAARPKLHRTGESYARMWRAVRSSKPGVSAQDLAQVSRTGYTQVRRYCKWLESEGYLKRHGVKGNTLLYRATALAKDQRETPYPPLPIEDPFAGERAAACRLVRLYMERDPYQPGVKRQIEAACRVILERLGQVAESDNTEEDDHVE